MVDCCFNCAAPCYAPYLGGITTFYIKSSISEGRNDDKPADGGPLVQQVNVNVVDALSVIFEGALKYSGAQIPTNEGGSPESSIGVCINCAAILIDLYTYYVKFMNLSTASSALAKCIQCRLWRFNCNNDVGVKVEPDNNNDSKYDDNDIDDDSDIEFLEEVIVKVKDEELGTFPDVTVNDDDDADDDIVKVKLDPLKLSSLVGEGPSSSQKKTVTKSNRLCPRYRKKLAKNRLAYALKRTAAAEAAGKIKCSYCPRYCVNQVNLDSHITRAHSSKLKVAYCCTLCGKLVRSSRGLTRHKKLTHGISVIKKKKKSQMVKKSCTICGKEMNSNYLKKHLQFVHGQAGYTKPSCKYCGNIYKSDASLYYHLQAKHSVEILAAAAAFAENPKPPNPRNNESDESQIPSSSSTSASHAIQRKKYASSGSRRHCHLCKMSFPNQLTFLQHKVQVHPEKCTKTNQFECPEENCARVFSDRLQLLVHESVVHGNKMDESQELLAGRTCGVCNKKFAYPSFLRVHQETGKCASKKDDDDDDDDDDKPKPKYTCGTCDKTFESLYTLRNHRINLHPNEQSSSSSTKLPNGTTICHECGKTFKDSTRLKQHLRSNAHAGSTRKYQCPTCSRLYSVEANYLAHLKLHSTSSLKSSLTCPECGLSSSTKANLQKHLFGVHGLGVYASQDASSNPTPYVCHHCGRAFKLKECLDQHLRTKQHGGPGLGVRVRPKKPTKRIVLELKELS